MQSIGFVWILQYLSWDREREGERETDRQAGRLTDRDRARETQRQTDRQTDRRYTQRVCVCMGTDRVGELVPEKNALLQTDEARGAVDGEEKHGVAVADDVVGDCVEGSLWTNE